MGMVLPPGERPDHEQALELARHQMDHIEFDRAWDRGRGMRHDEAVTHALDVLHSIDS
jgi:hypothetical protein